jgi:hypothetical protein
MNTQSHIGKVLHMVESLPDRNRKAFRDIFYTNPALIRLGVEWLHKHVKLRNGLPIKVFDFSAGDGLFGEVLKELFPNSIYEAFDINPTTDLVKQQDFLEMPDDSINTLNSFDVACFNPPFGREGRLALAFWKQALVYKPKWLLLILPLRPWKLSNMKIIERKLLKTNSFYTIEDGFPFSTAAEMMLIKVNNSKDKIPAVIEQKDFIFEVTDTRKELTFPENSMLFVRKVGAYAGEHCYVMSNKQNNNYEVNYIFRDQIFPESPEEFAVPEEKPWLAKSTPWGRRGHIVCSYDAGIKSKRGGQGFLKVYLPANINHDKANEIALYLTRFCNQNEVAFGAPKSINCAIVRCILQQYFTLQDCVIDDKK